MVVINSSCAGLKDINNPQYMPVLSEAMSSKKWKKLCGGQHHTLCLDKEGMRAQ
jgi:hypothetical protein